MQVVIEAPDTEYCRKMFASSLEIAIRFSVTSLEDFESIVKEEEQSILTQFKILVDFIPTPDRSRRVLFDQFHSLNYPENGFIWKDNIEEDFEEDPFEWLGDSLFTNFERLYNHLSNKGYYLETLY